MAITAHDPDLMRRIELERADAARVAEHRLLERVVDTLKADNVNPIYRAAYTRAIGKLWKLIDFKAS